MASSTTHDSSSSQDYQDRDINVMNIAISLIVIVVVTVSSAIGMLALHRTYAGTYEKQQEEAPALVKIREIPPGPKLQVNGRAELEEYDAVIAERLKTYEYTDKMRGVGRIPIDRALTILAERGLPHKEAP